VGTSEDRGLTQLRTALLVSIVIYVVRATHDVVFGDPNEWLFFVLVIVSLMIVYLFSYHFAGETNKLRWWRIDK
jgi:antibiotic biosynthesis monooxygenase (ABM) superfamily enzyme